MAPRRNIFPLNRILVIAFSLTLTACGGGGGSSSSGATHIPSGSSQSGTAAQWNYTNRAVNLGDGNAVVAVLSKSTSTSAAPTSSGGTPLSQSNSATGFVALRHLATNGTQSFSGFFQLGSKGSGMVYLGTNGLPTSIESANGLKLNFKNWDLSAGTVTISMTDYADKQIIAPKTVAIPAGVLSKLKIVVDNFKTQVKGIADTGTASGTAKAASFSLGAAASNHFIAQIGALAFGGASCAGNIFLTSASITFAATTAETVAGAAAGVASAAYFGRQSASSCTAFTTEALADLAPDNKALQAVSTAVSGVETIDSTAELNPTSLFSQESFYLHVTADTTLDYTPPTFTTIRAGDGVVSVAFNKGTNAPETKFFYGSKCALDALNNNDLSAEQYQNYVSSNPSCAYKSQTTQGTSVILPGTNGRTLYFEAVSVDSAGTYSHATTVHAATPEPSPTIAAHPGNLVLYAGASASLSAVLTNSSPGTTISWTVTGGTIGPSSSTQPLSGSAVSYTAPDTAGTYTITAISTADDNLKATVTVTVLATPSADAEPDIQASYPQQAGYEVSALSGSGGTLSPGWMQVDSGNTAQFSVIPFSGYQIGSVTGCQGSLNNGTYTTGAINGDCTVTASFVRKTPATSFTVLAQAGTGGAITPSSQTVKSGGTASFTLSPQSGYTIKGATGCGGSLSGNTYTTGSITAACTVTASFAVSSTGGGGITSLSDNFDDDNYTANPAWTLKTGYATGTGTVVATDGYARFERTGAGGGGGSAGLTIQTDIPVTDTTYIRFDALATSRDVADGCGYSCQEYPTSVKLFVDDSQGNQYTVRYAFNYGGAEKNISTATSKQYAFDIPQGQWQRNLAFNIRKAWPNAVRITEVYLAGNGWNFDGGIDNLAIVPGGDTSHVVSINSGNGGSIDPSGSITVNDGATQSFTVTADSGYRIDQVTGCGGTLNGSTFTTGPVTADCTVSASFTLTGSSGGGTSSYNVTTSHNTGGTISPTSTTVAAGDSATFTVTPDSGYKIGTVTGCQGVLSGNSFTTGPINNACTVSATFASAAADITFTNPSPAGDSTFVMGNAAPGYSVGVNDADGDLSTVEMDLITPDGRDILVSSMTVAQSQQAYVLEKDTLSTADLNTAGTYQVKVTAWDQAGHHGTFTWALTVQNSGSSSTQYTVTVNWSGNGSVSPGSMKVNAGDSLQMALTPDAGNAVDTVSGCQGTRTSDGSYTTGAINADCTVNVSFVSNGGSTSYQPITVQEVNQWLSDQGLSHTTTRQVWDDGFGNPNQIVSFGRIVLTQFSGGKDYLSQDFSFDFGVKANTSATYSCSGEPYFVFLLDSDGDPKTGYQTNGIGADRMFLIPNGNSPSQQPMSSYLVWDSSLQAWNATNSGGEIDRIKGYGTTYGHYYVGINAPVIPLNNANEKGLISAVTLTKVTNDLGFAEWKANCIAASSAVFSTN